MLFLITCLVKRRPMNAKINKIEPNLKMGPFGGGGGGSFSSVSQCHIKKKGEIINHIKESRTIPKPPKEQSFPNIQTPCSWLWFHLISNLCGKGCLRTPILIMVTKESFLWVLTHPSLHHIHTHYIFVSILNWKSLSLKMTQVVQIIHMVWNCELGSIDAVQGNTFP